MQQFHDLYKSLHQLDIIILDAWNDIELAIYDIVGWKVWLWQ